MQCYVITEGYIKSVIENAACDDNIKHILQSSTGRQTLSQFIYEVFCYFMPAYEDPRVTGYPNQDVHNLGEVFLPLIRRFGSAGDTNMRVTDPFDTIYNRCYPGAETVFDSSLFDTLYASVEDLYGFDTANNCFSDVIKLLEHIVIQIELSFLYFQDVRDGTSCFKVFLHFRDNYITVFVH